MRCWTLMNATYAILPGHTPVWEKWVVGYFEKRLQAVPAKNSSHAASQTVVIQRVWMFQNFPFVGRNSGLIRPSTPFKHPCSWDRCQLVPPKNTNTTAQYVVRAGPQPG